MTIESLTAFLESFFNEDEIDYMNNFEVYQIGFEKYQKEMDSLFPQYRIGE